MAASIAIRPAEAADADEVSAIAREAYAPYVTRIGREPAPMSADHAAAIERGEVWVATGGAEVVGFVVVRPQEGSMLLESVAVSPAFQGMGVGRALIAFAESCARSAGLAEIELYTNERMTENLAYYPRLGYVERERRHEDGFDRVYFRKPL